MIATLDKTGCTLTREKGDKRIPKESTVVFHMRNLLNAQGHHFVRIQPPRYGLNDCPSGLADHKAGIFLWHERYAIEDAAKEFNDGKVWFQRVDDKVETVAEQVLADYEEDEPDWAMRVEMARDNNETKD